MSDRIRAARTIRVVNLRRRDIIDLVLATEMLQLRAGTEHRWIDMWVVVADDRLFCRQWGFSERSWYQAFQAAPDGALRCGETILPVEGVIPPDLDEIGERVNAAYLEQYGTGERPDIARQMTGPRFMARTMELIPVVARL